MKNLFRSVVTVSVGVCLSGANVYAGDKSYREVRCDGGLTYSVTAVDASASKSVEFAYQKNEKSSSGNKGLGTLELVGAGVAIAGMFKVSSDNWGVSGGRAVSTGIGMLALTGAAALLAMDGTRRMGWDKDKDKYAKARLSYEISKGLKECNNGEAGFVFDGKDIKLDKDLNVVAFKTSYVGKDSYKHKSLRTFKLKNGDFVSDDLNDPIKLVTAEGERNTLAIVTGSIEVENN